jgi:endoglucanase
MTIEHPSRRPWPDCAFSILRALLAIALIMLVPVAAVAAAPAPASKAEAPSADIDAWSAAKAMGIGVNIGNTLENTTTWETGWGNPPITREFVQSLAAHGFGVVRVPVAWDTYAHNGQIDRDKLKHVGEVVDWITSAGMFAVVNIHWDGGWIDSDVQKKFPKTYRTFSPEAEQKFKSYWTQIATYFANRDQHVVFESLNEESNFENAGSEKKAFATLGHVNQLFIDTVRATGGNNAKRLLIIAGYSTNIDKTTSSNFVLPNDSVPHKLLLSVHYYTPWPFVGMEHDESWGKMTLTWGDAHDRAELKEQMDKMEAYSKEKDIPAFIGEFGASNKKDSRSRARWMLAVALSAEARDMVPVLWDIGQDVTRRPPFNLSPELSFVLKEVQNFNSENAASPGQ